MVHYLTEQEFVDVYSKVPRLTVDVLVKDGSKFLLSRRSIEPYKGLWHIPGGTVYKGETIEEAAKRIVIKETGLDITVEGCLGYGEFFNELHFGSSMQTVSIIIAARQRGGALKHNGEADDIQWFSEVPKDVVEQHKNFLMEQGYKTDV